jgi:malonate transporter
MSALLEVILPVFLVLGAGYLAVRTGHFSMSAVDGLMKFTQRFAIPCLLFRAISTIDLQQGFNLPLIASFYTGATVGFVLGLCAARWGFGRSWEDSVAIGFCCLFSNSVLLGLPIAERAYGAASLSTNFAIIAVHAPFCLGLGITAMELVKNRSANGFRMIGTILSAMFRNALVVGIVLGLAVNLSGITLPHAVADAADLLTRAALPAALFGLGGALTRYSPQGDIATIACVIAISLIVHPLVVWLMGQWLDLPQVALRSAVITAAMAPGANTYIFADLYGHGRRVAASAVLGGTAVSLLTVWAWLQVLG